MSNRKRYRDASGRFAKRPRYSASTIRKYRAIVETLAQQIATTLARARAQERNLTKAEGERRAAIAAHNRAMKAAETREQNEQRKIDAARVARESQRSDDAPYVFKRSGPFVIFDARKLSEKALIELVEDLMAGGLKKFRFVSEIPKSLDYARRYRTDNVSFGAKTTKKQIKAYIKRLQQNEYSISNIHFWDRDLPTNSELWDEIGEGGESYEQYQADLAARSVEARKRIKRNRERREQRVQEFMARLALYENDISRLSRLLENTFRKIADLKAERENIITKYGL